MRPLVIDDRAKDRIKILIDFAERNIISMDMLLDMVNGKEQNIADIPDFKVELFGGFEVTYTIEQQFHPTEGECRVKHLCIRLKESKKDAIPSVPHSYLIMEEFGIKDFGTCKVQIDKEKNLVEIWHPIIGKPFEGGTFYTSN